MKNKTLLILLIIPFIIGLLSFVSVIVLNNTVASDIVDITWTYLESEGFKLESGKKYPLKAEAVVDPNLILASGNNLIWTIKNEDKDDPVATIEKNEEYETYYLVPLKEGEAIVTCQNERGTKAKSFKAVIYENGTVLINPTLKGSEENVDKIRYFGEYDLSYKDEMKMDNYSKIHTSLSFECKVLGDEVTSNTVKLKSKEGNIECNESDNSISITFTGAGEASFTVYSEEKSYISGTYSLNIVEDAVNIYSYNDLLHATNFSSKGETIVLQKNLESLSNTYKTNEASNYIKEYKKDNTVLFGNYDFATKRFNFENELYLMETTYIKDYIDQYNAVNTDNPGTDKIKVGVRIQKDVYGNGFTINAHNLAFPNNGSYKENGKLTPDRNLDYFFGPLALVTIGSLEELSIVKAYGQDNINVLVDKDNVTINDLKIRNTNNIDNLYDLTYTGTALEINARNVMVKNSLIDHAKNGIRAFSADNFTLKNSIVSRCSEFLVKVGSNKHSLVDENQNVSFTYNGNSVSSPFTTFYNEKADTGNLSADLVLTETLQKNLTSSDLESMHAIQSYLDNVKGIYNEDGTKNYDATINIIDSSFYSSGIFSIALECAFNGIFLYNGYPSMIADSLLPMLNGVAPSKIGRTSYPVKVNVKGKSKFYDDKKVDSIDTSGLIEENISMAFPEQNLSIDDFFPMKRILKRKCSDLNYIYNYENNSYLNTICAYYGGGLNLSDIEFDLEESENTISDKIEVNVMEEIYASSAEVNFISLLAKAVNLAAGFNSFNFITNETETDPSLFNKVPDIETLKSRS